MASTLLMLAGALCVLTAILHSLLGERRLIGPLMESKSKTMKSDLAKQVLRFAWHWTSALWCLVGMVLFMAAGDHDVPRDILLAIGIVHLVVGLLDGIFTKGKHIGWPFITLIGGLTLLAVYSNV